MTINITLRDANKDGKGVNFDGFIKAFNKNYEDHDGRGDFNGKVVGNMTEDNPLRADGYVTHESLKGGRSVLFNGPGDFTYSGFEEHNGDAHVVYGDLNSMVFGNNTKIKSLAGDSSKYTNSQDIVMSGFEAFETTTQSGELLGDLKDGKTGSLIAFLNSESINFVGSKGRDTFTAFKNDDTLHGGAGNDQLKGALGDDTIWGDAGNDRLGGGDGADTFVFAANHGNDRITDFQAGEAGTDLLDFGSMFANFDDVLDAATNTNGGVKIEYDGGSVLLTGVNKATLTEGDFVFAI